MTLTEREREIGQLVAQDLTRRQIARRLGLSIHTVDTHIAKLARKLDSDDRLPRLRRIRRAFEGG